MHALSRCASRHMVRAVAESRARRSRATTEIALSQRQLPQKVWGLPRRMRYLGLNPPLVKLCFTLASEPGPPAARVFHGGRSSMVELQIVILAVAGSSPVGRPFFS